MRIEERLFHIVIANGRRSGAEARRDGRMSPRSSDSGNEKRKSNGLCKICSQELEEEQNNRGLMCVNRNCPRGGRIIKPNYRNSKPNTPQRNSHVNLRPNHATSQSRLRSPVQNERLDKRTPRRSDHR